MRSRTVALAFERSKSSATATKPGAFSFEEMHHIPTAVAHPSWAGFLGRFQMFIGKRTENIKSALDPAYRQALDNAIRII
jgi:hypothetical protein